MTAEQAKVLEKVKKLMALGQGDTAEAQAALAKAQQLMSQYNLSLSEVELKQDTQFAQGKVTRKSREADRAWENTLFTAIAKLFDCENCVSSRSKDEVTYIFFGTALDSEVASYTFEQLRNRLLEIASDAMSQYNEQFKETYGSSAYKLPHSHVDHPMMWRKSWLIGAAEGINTQCKAILSERAKAAQAQQATYAIVHLKNEMVASAFVAAFPYLRHKSLRSNVKNGTAFHEGHRVGASMQIHEGITA